MVIYNEMALGGMHEMLLGNGLSVSNGEQRDGHEASGDKNYVIFENSRATPGATASHI
jgi:hypothetical protein